MNNIIPKIVFKYSSIYDFHWQEWFNFKYGNINNRIEAQYIRNYIHKIDKIWGKDEKIILKEFAKITNLKWGAKTISCYIVSKCIPISDPLTMQPYHTDDRFIDVLIHELIHQLFVQKDNIKSVKRALKYLEEEYVGEAKKTIIHVPLYAIHKHIYLKLYNEARLKRDIKLSNNFPEYKRAWEIVQEKGYKEIFKMLK